MNVIVPLGGVGSRFQKEGYLTRPKPFVPVLGKPMILWVLDNLTLRDGDDLVLVYNPDWMSMDNFMREVVAEKYPHCRLVPLEGPTRGAAETVMIGLRALPETARSRPTLLADGDTFYTADVVQRFRDVSATHNAVFCFHDTQPQPIYSYLELDQNDNVERVKEKVKISDWANTGCYCFRNGSELMSECVALIKAGEMQLSQDQKGEFYTSGVIATMIAKQLPFRALKLEAKDFHVLGIPSQVKDFCKSWPQQPKKHFVFDLEGVLASPSKVKGGGLASCSAIKRNVEACRWLKAKGHALTIETTRAKDADTANWLARNNIPYDEVLFGVPRGDFHISGLTSSIDGLLGDLDTQLGFYKDGAPASGTDPRALQASSSAQSSSSQDTMPVKCLYFSLGLAAGVVLAKLAANRSLL